MFERVRRRIARWLAPATPRISRRMYHAARPSRLMTGFGQNDTSADSELITSLRSMRQKSRELVRDAAFAKRAKVIVVNNVVGPGIGMQAQVMTTRGQLNNRVNDEIEEVWMDWARADSCHTGGSLHFADLERAAMGQVFEAGEVFLRKHYRRFGSSEIPYALELIEAERCADEFQPGPIGAPEYGVRLGVECDQFLRPVAYWFRTLHPGELRLTAEQTSRVERVPADQIIHLRLIDRWPQTRGEPWLHAVMRKFNDLDAYSEAEIEAARAAACQVGTVETPEQAYGQEQEDGSRQIDIEPVIIERLAPGEKMTWNNPNRPNSNADPFLRFMLRELAAGCGVSYESLSRDYSESNYSSSRLALLDDRDLWRMLQLWFLRNFREICHREWIQAAVFSGALTTIGREEYALNRRKFEAVRFKPRGWSWIDPTSEVEAYKEAIRAGLTTQTDVIAMTADGRDLEDILTTRRQELDLAKEKGLKFDTETPAQSSPAAPAASHEPETEVMPEVDEMMAMAGTNGGGRRAVCE